MSGAIIVYIWIVFCFCKIFSTKKRPGGYSEGLITASCGPLLKAMARHPEPNRRSTGGALHQFVPVCSVQYDAVKIKDVLLVKQPFGQFHQRLIEHF